MREVARDDKWKDEREANDARRDSYATTEAADADGTSEGFAAGQLMTTGPSETELVTVALLMRLYDINLALLNHFDPARANEIYDAHEKGGSFNPPIFIPQVGDEEQPVVEAEDVQ